MKKVFALIEKESLQFAQLPFFEFLGNKSINPIQRLSFAPFALFVMGYGDFNKFIWLEEPTLNPIQDIVNKQIREEESHWIWVLKNIEEFDFNRFFNLTDYLKFNWSAHILICKQTISELYRRAFQVNPISKLVTIESIESILNLINMLVNFAEEYKIKQLLTRSFGGSDSGQLLCGILLQSGFKFPARRSCSPYVTLFSTFAQRVADRRCA